MPLNLLKSTDERIKAIAFAAGYNHTSSFVRAFIVLFKESPISYRHPGERRGDEFRTAQLKG